LTELSFDKVKHIPVSQKTPGFRAISCYDGTEISTTSAFELLKAFSAEERKQLRERVGQLDVGGQGNLMLYSPNTGHGLSADEGFEDFVGESGNPTGDFSIDLPPIAPADVLSHRVG
jgi:hypothetical protein